MNIWKGKKCDESKRSEAAGVGRKDPGMPGEWGISTEVVQRAAAVHIDILPVGAGDIWRGTKEGR